MSVLHPQPQGLFPRVGRWWRSVPFWLWDAASLVPAPPGQLDKRVWGYNTHSLSNDSGGKGVVGGTYVSSILEQHPNSSSLDDPGKGGWKTQR